MAVAGTDPVTVAVTFHVKPGHTAEFETWAHEITDASARYPGHLGASWVRSGGAYHVIYRFADHALFKGWYDSEERAGFLKRVRPIATVVTNEHLTGFETWFQLPGQPGRPAPPKWKMVVATWFGVFPLLALLQWLVAPRLVDVPLVLRVMLFAFIAVVLMTYLVMPQMTRLLRRWLYPP
ncbi:MAG: antibiotic biosynthesis monooxygenase [Candidatus Dormiibacterota bacterium]